MSRTRSSQNLSRMRQYFPISSAPCLSLNVFLRHVPVIVHKTLDLEILAAEIANSFALIGCWVAEPMLHTTPHSDRSSQRTASSTH